MNILVIKKIYKLKKNKKNNVKWLFVTRVTYPGYKKIYTWEKNYGACKLTRTPWVYKKKPEKKKRKKHFQILINSENWKKKWSSEIYCDAHKLTRTPQLSKKWLKKTCQTLMNNRKHCSLLKNHFRWQGDLNSSNLRKNIYSYYL